MRVLEDGITIQTKYLDEPCATVLLGEYSTNGTPAIVIEDAHGERLCVATANLESYGEIPQEGHVFIKNWSENEGILGALVKADIISAPVRDVEAGFTTAYECPLLP